MQISEQTVRAHIQRVFRRLGVASKLAVKEVSFRHEGSHPEPVKFRSGTRSLRRALEAVPPQLQLKRASFLFSFSLCVMTIRYRRYRHDAVFARNISLRRKMHRVPSFGSRSQSERLHCLRMTKLS